MTYQTLQLAKWYGVSPVIMNDLPNLKFYDWYEYMLIQSAIDDSYMKKAHRGNGN